MIKKIISMGIMSIVKNPRSWIFYDNQIYLYTYTKTKKLRKRKSSFGALNLLI